MKPNAWDKLAPPPLAVFAALILWGWQAGVLPWAFGMGALLEAARFSRLRFDPGQNDFNRLWNLTTLLFLGVALYLFLAREGLGSVGTLMTPNSSANRLEGLRQLSQTALAFLRGFPFILFPFVLAHAWSRTPALPWSTFSIYLRARAARTHSPATGGSPRHPAGAGGRTSEPDSGQRASQPAKVRAPEAPSSPVPESRHARGVLAPALVHPGYPYLALVLFASCTSTAHPLPYLPLLVGVVSWALWPWRNRRFGAPLWATLLGLVLGTSAAAQQGVLSLRGLWQELENRLMQRAGDNDSDQQHSFTALGKGGRVKQSSRIVLRVHTADGEAPGLLREAAFNRFRGNVWTSVHQEFQTATPLLEGLLWRLAPQGLGGRSMAIARYTSQGKAPLALPGDTFAIRDLAAPTVETNLLAAARLRFGPPLVTYTVDHGEGGGFDGAPEADDTDLEHLAETDRAAIQGVAAELGLATQPPPTAIVTVQRYFAANFEYSLQPPRKPGAGQTSALAVFLRDSKAGHCEYFASATVLLLRAAGVPTRYAVGYSVTRSRGEDWVGRQRDAHAWCLAFVEGRWQDVDTTPAGGRESESALAGWWEGVSDRVSDAWYRFALWRQRGNNWRLYALAASLMVLSWLGWRQIRGSRWRRARATGAGPKPRVLRPGLDSEFYAVAKRLEATRGPRLPHETMSAWIRRLRLESAPNAARLREALNLHGRLRFDPPGLAVPERERLRELAGQLSREEGDGAASG